MSPDPADSSWSYRPDEDNELTNLFRQDAALEAVVDALLASVRDADAARILVPYLLQREFLTKRQMRPIGP